MSYLFFITSKSQVIIPAKIRRNLGLNKYKKAFIKKEIDEIIELEEEAVGR